MNQLDRIVDEVQQRVAVMEPDDRFHPLNSFIFQPKVDCPGVLTPFEELKGVPEYRVTDHSYMQMAERLGFGRHARYVQSLPTSIRGDAMQFHMHVSEKRYTKALMFRSVNDDVERTTDRRLRALMTDQYQPFDDIDLFPAVRGAFRDMGVYDPEVKLESFDETSCHVRMVWGREERIGERGEAVRKGIHISNSEVGVRSVVIRPVVWVLVCSNGMLGRKDMGQIRHVGNSDRLRGKVRDAIGMAVNDTDRLSAQFAESLKVKFENPVNVLEGIHKDTEMTQDQFKRTLARFTEGDGHTKFDVVQAITRAAQDEDTAEGRYGMEMVGAKALDTRLERYDEEVA